MNIIKEFYNEIKDLVNKNFGILQNEIMII